MPHLLNIEIPKYEALLELSQRYPAMDPLSTVTFLQILVAGDELFRSAGKTFRNHQISKGKFMLLMQLFDKESGSSRELSPAEIADKTCVTRATVSGLLDGLERDGLIIRKQDEKDRRMVVVSLTHEGIELMERFLPIHFARIQELMAGLNTEEKRLLQELLNKVRDHVAEVAPTTPGEECDCSL